MAVYFLSRSHRATASGGSGGALISLSNVQLNLGCSQPRLRPPDHRGCDLISWQSMEGTWPVRQRRNFRFLLNWGSGRMIGMRTQFEL